VLISVKAKKLKNSVASDQSLMVDDDAMYGSAIRPVNLYERWSNTGESQSWCFRIIAGKLHYRGSDSVSERLCRLADAIGVPCGAIAIDPGALLVCTLHHISSGGPRAWTPDELAI
jgi:hypothetical protein